MALMLASIHSFITHKHNIIFLKMFSSNEHFALMGTFQTPGIAEGSKEMLEDL